MHLYVLGTAWFIKGCLRSISQKWKEIKFNPEKKNILKQGYPNFVEIGPHVNIENYGRAGYHILFQDYINNTPYYMAIIFK